MPKKTGCSCWTSPDCMHCVFTVPWSIGARPWDDFECSVRFQRGVPLQIMQLVVGNMITLRRRNRIGLDSISVQVLRVHVTDDGRRATATMAVVG